jgi:DNA-binding MarR family transcriptional regulator
MRSQETRWLTADEQLAWRTFLTACHTLFATVEGQLLRDSDIPHGYYEILVRLSEAPGRALRMTQLAEASTSSKSRLSHAVARLEERGWVKRMDCATDRRGQIAQLTDKGFAALAAAAPGHAEQVRRSLIDRLTPEQVTQLREISDAILADAEPLPEGSEGCGGCDAESSADAD